MSNNNAISPVSWIIFILATLIWGFSFQMMKWGLMAFSAYQLACIRILSAGFLFLPFFSKYIRKVNKQDIFWIALSSLLGSLMPAFLFCVAETQVDGTTAGILNSTTPILTFLIGLLFFHHRFTTRQLLGVILGFLSVLLIILSENQIKQVNIMYSLLIVLATLGYAINVWIISKKLAQVGAFTIATVGLTINIIPAGIIFLCTDYVSAYNHPQFSSSLSAGLFLGIIATAIVGYVFFLLIKRSSAVFASTVTYAIPLVGILVGLSVGEMITLWQILGILGILVGIYLSRPLGAKKHASN